MLPRKLAGFAIAAWVLCGWAAADGTTARAEGFLQPSSHQRLTSGATVEVAWGLESDRGSDYDEMELVLSLDGGRSFPLRLTRGLSPTTGRTLWRVPSLATEHARLALRTGSDEAEETEIVRLVGPEFAIDTLPTDSLEALFRVGGEWRTREALESPVNPGFPESLDGDSGGEWTASRSASRAAEPPRPLTIEDRSDRRVQALMLESAPSRSRPAADLHRLPGVPLRQ